MGMSGVGQTGQVISRGSVSDFVNVMNIQEFTLYRNPIVLRFSYTSS